MDRYTLHCTPEQAKKALELGATLKQVFYSIQFKETMEQYHLIEIGYKLYKIPTAEQMFGWLEEQGIRFTIQSKNEDITFGFCVRDSNCTEVIATKGNIQSRKKATLAAIDTALEYLSNK